MLLSERAQEGICKQKESMHIVFVSWLKSQQNTKQCNTPRSCRAIRQTSPDFDSLCRSCNAYLFSSCCAPWGTRSPWRSAPSGWRRTQSPPPAPDRLFSPTCRWGSLPPRAERATPHPWRPKHTNKFFESRADTRGRTKPRSCPIVKCEQRETFPRYLHQSVSGSFS